jgi:hypothetical protein
MHGTVVVKCRNHQFICAHQLLAFAVVRWFAVNENLWGSISLRDGLFLVLVLVVASFVLLHVFYQVLLQNAEDQVKPKEIDCLKTGKKTERDDLTDPAFVLLGLPVQLERSHGSELGQDSPDDFQVDIMSQVDPN